MTTALDIAKELINDYCQKEFGDNADFSDLECVHIAYTTDEETETTQIPIQVSVDLVHCRIITEYDDVVVREEQYRSLEYMCENVLPYLEFDDLISLSDKEKAKAAPTIEERIVQELRATEGTDKYYVNSAGETVTQVYYNPDSAAGGQLVYNTLSFYEVEEAIKSGDYSEYFSANSRQECIDITDDTFANHAKGFLSKEESFNNRDYSVEDELKKIVSLAIDNDHHCGRISDDEYVQRRLPVMSKLEKERHIFGAEMAIDYGDKISEADYKLYLKLIDERAAQSTKSLISITECGIQKYYISNGYSPLDLMIRCSMSERPYAALARCGKETTEAKYAEIQQSDSFSFSADINFDNHTVQIYQSHNAAEPERTHENSSIGTYSLNDVLSIVDEVCTEASDYDARNTLFLQRLQNISSCGGQSCSDVDSDEVLDLTSKQNIGRK